VKIRKGWSPKCCWTVVSVPFATLERHLCQKVRFAPDCSIRVFLNAIPRLEKPTVTAKVLHVP
jgi:hypothetical protein